MELRQCCDWLRKGKQNCLEFRGEIAHCLDWRLNRSRFATLKCRFSTCLDFPTIPSNQLWLQLTRQEEGRTEKKKTTLEAFPLEKTKETVHNVLFSTHNQEVKRQQRHAGCFCTFGAAGWTHRCLINDLSSAEGKGEDLQPRPSGLLTHASASLPRIQVTEAETIFSKNSCFTVCVDSGNAGFWLLLFVLVISSSAISSSSNSEQKFLHLLQLHPSRSFHLLFKIQN